MADQAHADSDDHGDGTDSATRLVWPAAGPGPYGSGLSSPYAPDPYAQFGARRRDGPSPLDSGVADEDFDERGEHDVDDHDDRHNDDAGHGHDPDHGAGAGAGHDHGRNGHDVVERHIWSAGAGGHAEHPHLAEWAERADRAAERAWSWFGRLADQAAARLPAHPPGSAGPRETQEPAPEVPAGTAHQAPVTARPGTTVPPAATAPPGAAASPDAAASPGAVAPPATAPPGTAPGLRAGQHVSHDQPQEITVHRFPPPVPPVLPPGEVPAAEPPSSSSAAWPPGPEPSPARAPAGAPPAEAAGGATSPSTGTPSDRTAAAPSTRAAAAPSARAVAPPAETPAGARAVRPTVGYALHGGEADAHRLARQSRALEPGTEAFLTGLGLGPGWRCLDVGCGHGQVSVLLASQVRPGGRIVGVDGDPASLRVARHNAARVGARVAFLNAEAGWLPAARGRFDLAYCRLLLGHLADPMETLRAMATAVRPGGVVAVEDVYFTVPSTTATPDDPLPGALAEFIELLTMTIRAQGGDPQIGPRLPALFTAAGLTDISAGLSAAPLPLDSPLLLAEALDATRDATLAAGLASATHLDDLRAALLALPRTALTATIDTARIHQVAGHRPRRPSAQAA
ncbi:MULTISPECIES: class I SAM-dependent methyltransferase [unclassified Pseudofrankia]|uniref:class I SAM-dependent methyltransferase n=1 Tax=unclassified Pseudofrankia TaxID=2994372 RepID=UPI0008DA3BED|nr:MULTISPECIES: class I SAM-dependent methyltransferase [unclassified Pseudofrankia]MDT3442108.1 methyltransferase domain-containing protein [Pseudofrankia sp. BMG5.37]OHV47248.1 hypothetical protein BCD48_19580 [Pseudofrankia sp. BMG5.36]